MYIFTTDQMVRVKLIKKYVMTNGFNVLGNFY